MKMTLKHPSGVTKEVKTGFSWTILFFGFIALLIRGQIKEELIILLTFWLGIGIIYQIYLAFKGNEKQKDKFLLKGFEIQ